MNIQDIKCIVAQLVIEGCDDIQEVNIKQISPGNIEINYRPVQETPEIEIEIHETIV
jgi:hypothetical protein